LLATNLPLLPRRLELPLALLVDFLPPPRQYVQVENRNGNCEMKVA
jgi:hypothetical protein